jgi:hypothetical protein
MRKILTFISGWLRMLRRFFSTAPKVASSTMSRWVTPETEKAWLASLEPKTKALLKKSEKCSENRTAEEQELDHRNIQETLAKAEETFRNFSAY